MNIDNIHWVVFVVVGAVFAALYNVFSKKVQTGDWKNRSSALVALHQGFAALILLGISVATGGPVVKPGFWLPIVVTGVLNIGIMFGKMRARALEDVSLVTPIDSTTPAVVIVTSMIILGEYPSTMGWVGIWLLVVGTYILNIQDVRQKLAERMEKEGTPPAWWRVYLAPFLALGKSAGVRWAFFAVALSTISLNYDGMVARTSDIGFGFGCVMLIAALGNLVVAIFRKEFAGMDGGQAFRKSAILAIFFAGNIFITAFAFRYSIVPYVGTMKRIQIPLTIILAFFIVGEKKSFKERFAGGAIMTAGAVLIGLA